MRMKNHFLVLICALLALNANAALHDRGNGLIYDDLQDITWWHNADVIGIDSVVNWEYATNTVADLVLAGHTDWRMPSTLLDDPSCRDENSSGPNCTGSEMGHLFYVTMSGIAGDVIGAHDPDSLSLFDNMKHGWYWSSTVDPNPSSSNTQYAFYTANGIQVPHSSSAWVMAVHDGDIGAVPLPAAAWLFLSGLVGLAAIKRKRS